MSRLKTNNVVLQRLEIDKLRYQLSQYKTLLGVCPFDKDVLKGDVVSTANIILSNTKINSVRKITEDVPNLNIYTEGTLCSIQGAAIITLLNYASNADAIADGRIKNMLYRNNVTGVITQVI